MKLHHRLTLHYVGAFFTGIVLFAGLLYVDVIPLDWVPASLAAKKVSDPENRSEAFTDVTGEIHEYEGDENEGFDSELAVALWCGIPGTLLAGAVGWWATRHAIVPLRRMTRSAASIHEGNLHQRLALSGNGDELDDLSEVFNQMLERLDGSFQKVRDFTFNASHELKTPLTIMHHQLETALSKREQAAFDAGWFAAQLDEVQRLMTIVDGLGFLTQADASQIAFDRQPVPFDELVRESYEHAQVLSESRKLRVELIACDPCTVRGDRHRLRQTLLNLIDNAVKYSDTGGWIGFVLRQNGTEAELAISNTGPGIEPAAQTRVCERFFRGPAARDGGISGCGLGLSIAQSIISAHKGSIQISSQPGSLTTVSIRLPITL